jgi:NADH:ubiquinone oxidoreductase subunit 6 (subunit J)
MTAVLVLIALLMLTGAALAMLQRDLIHSALCLVLTWVGLAFFYLWAGAEFIAFAQVLIYVGAISMVVLFAVLLTRRSAAGPAVATPAATLARLSAGLLAAGAVGGVLAGTMVSTRFAVRRGGRIPTLTVRQLGDQLLGPQAAALLVVGVILTVALIGAVVIAAAEPDRRPEDSP